MSIDETRELFAGIFLPLVLGMIGCAVRLCRFGVQSLRQLFASVSASCFVAVLVYWGLDMLTFPPTVDAAIVGASSYLGGTLLDAFQHRAIKAVKEAPGPGANQGGQ